MEKYSTEYLSTLVMLVKKLKFMADNRNLGDFTFAVYDPEDWHEMNWLELLDRPQHLKLVTNVPPSAINRIGDITTYMRTQGYKGDWSMTSVINWTKDVLVNVGDYYDQILRDYEAIDCMTFEPLNNPYPLEFSNMVEFFVEVRNAL